MTNKPQSTKPPEETLEPCPNPDCQSAKATTSNDFANYYVYCPDCFLRGPRESVDHYGARWNALARISPANVAPVVDANEVMRQIRDNLINGNPATLIEDIAKLVEPKQEGESKCEHGVPWSMECLSCGPSDYCRLSSGARKSRSSICLQRVNQMASHGCEAWRFSG